MNLNRPARPATRFTERRTAPTPRRTVATAAATALATGGAAAAHATFGAAAALATRLAAAALATCLAAAARAEPVAILHISDLHIDVYNKSTGPARNVRGADTLRWICEQAAGPQVIDALDMTVPPPALALMTGDITEFGVIDDTWPLVEETLACLKMPVHAIPGNHDNTWTAMYHILRRRHGGENYSFDHAGIHFACISSSSPQEPMPTIDGKARAWLRDDLERVGRRTPIMVALHHPLYSNEFAQPAEIETLVDFLRDYNTVLLLYGHGHSVDTRDNGGIRGVMGGSTFGKNAGYGVLTIDGGVMRYAYRYHPAEDPTRRAAGPESKWVKLFEEAIPQEAPPRLFAIVSPLDGAVAEEGVVTLTLAADGAALDFEALAANGLAVRIDGKPARLRPGGEPGAFVLDVSQLDAGRRHLAVAVHLPDGRRDTRTRSFATPSRDVREVWRTELPAAIKAGLVLVGDLLLVARTDGVLSAFDAASGAPRWEHRTGAELLATPAVDDGLIVAPSGDGGVHAIGVDGRARWSYEVGDPVYGAPLIADGAVYVGDNVGRMHAIDLASGARRWVFERAGFGIEGRPARWRDLLVFTAWDGYVYGLDANTGQQRWRTPGPKANEGKAVRYYAPGDCGPVAVNGSLLVCDRGYMLGSYAADGALLRSWPMQVAAITACAASQTVYARGLDDRVLRLESTGCSRWEAEVGAGRFPIPPTVHAGRVYVCSNAGVATALDAETGGRLWSYRATTGFFVMAPIAAGEVGGHAMVFVAGMDGSLTAIADR